MISVIIYGSNDSYGYNLHKRAAISINSIAEVLSDPDDEILFVDFNSNNHFPTFPEAISDLLTDHSKKLLRIFRVRPEIYNAKYANMTHLRVLEPISRNVAIRRSNPKNRWVLSTNSDMIFLVKSGQALSDIVKHFEDGFYCAPRIDLPTFIWERFNRLEPQKILNDINIISKNIHLNEIVQSNAENLYDAPGDFQLFLREDLFKFGGFDEQMIHGWHCDSNIAKRFFLKYKYTGDAGKYVIGYHCEHTLKPSVNHAPNFTSNSLERFVDEIISPYANSDNPCWGLSDYHIEEIRLNQINIEYVTLVNTIETPQYEFTFLNFADPEDRDKTNFTHILSHLIDKIVYVPNNSVICWIGPKDGLFDLFYKYLQLISKFKTIGLVPYSDELKLELISGYVLNFGCPNITDEFEEYNLRNQIINQVLRETNNVNFRNSPSKPFIAINSAFTKFDEFVNEYFLSCLSPFQTHVRLCFIDTNKSQIFTSGDHNLLNLVRVLGAGRRVSKVIRSTGKGVIFSHTNDLRLSVGLNRISLTISSISIVSIFNKFYFEILEAGNVLYSKGIKIFRKRNEEFIFVVNIEPSIELDKIVIQLRSTTIFGRIKIHSLQISKITIV